MMKEVILSAVQFRMWDAETVVRQKITSLDLMERAAEAFVFAFSQLSEVTENGRITIVCGTGNNGGDGMAIARLLFKKGHVVRVVIAGDTEKASDDFKANREQLPRGVVVIPMQTTADWDEALKDSAVIIDALFGTGLSRPVSGEIAEGIHRINASAAVRVSVDVPSGMFADQHALGPVVCADYTITFQTHKMAFQMPENMLRTGQVIVADIGLDREFLRSLVTPFYRIGEQQVRALLPVRPKVAHKGMYGHALIMAGSRGKIGAAVLSARAALRTGCGLVTAHVPGCGYAILQTAVPEAMVLPDSDEDELSMVHELGSFRAIAIGPGLGTGKKAARVVRELLDKAPCPLVLDADALNIFAADSGLLHSIPRLSILTPHPGEFKRLVGEWKDDFHRLDLLRRFSAQSGSIIILKGAATAVAFPDGRVAFNTSGNPYMATAGSGDVLTGVLVSLLAQGLKPEDAAVAGVFIHGAAGDHAAGIGHPIIASDIIDALPDVLAKKPAGLLNLPSDISA